MGVGKISKMIWGLPMKVGVSNFDIVVVCFETAIADLKYSRRNKQALIT